jgi:DNA end-binding protein Ku
MTTKWDPRQYKDEYKSSLMKLIETKAESGDAKLPKAKRPRRSTRVIDLTDILRKSLSEVGPAPGKRQAKGTKSKRRKAA